MIKSSMVLRILMVVSRKNSRIPVNMMVNKGIGFDTKCTGEAISHSFPKSDTQDKLV